MVINRKAVAMDSFRKLAGLKTLLIDDNKIVRDTLTMFFTNKKCFIEAVATAEAGLRALEREHFDVIICDFRLPGINGVEFFKQAIQSHPDTIRVLISGYGNEETIAEALDMGVHEFMKKPFSPISFVDRLRPYIDKYLAGKFDGPEPVEKSPVYKCNKTKPPGVKEELSIYRLIPDI
jgi:DNA-binding NtrC family response regulator